MPSQDPLITLRSASKAFGNNTVLSSVDLNVDPGKLIVILGENGAGKTTLLRIMAGLLGLDQGLLTIDGQELDRLSETQREKIFFLPDFPALFDELSILENIEIWLSLYSKGASHREDEAIKLLEVFDLIKKANIPAGMLSRGQRFKLALICYEVVEAPIGLFDEPFAAGMDASGIKEMRTLIRNATHKERSVVYTTQLVTYALDFADRVLVIHDSGVYFDGPPDEFDQRLKAGDSILEKFTESDA